MDTRLSTTIASAALLGAVAGVVVSPLECRQELLRRLRHGTRRIVRALREDEDRLATAVYVATSTMARLTEEVVDIVRSAVLPSHSPIARLRRALSDDAKLRERAIIVDAAGDTLLLQGVVADDEEWRAADLLARDASPDGSVRNLLRVEHHD
jgi:prophage DNA circulation protein